MLLFGFVDVLEDSHLYFDYAFREKQPKQIGTSAAELQAFLNPLAFIFATKKMFSGEVKKN